MYSIECWYYNIINCVCVCVGLGGNDRRHIQSHQTSTIRAVLDHGKDRFVCGEENSTSLIQPLNCSNKSTSLWLMLDSVMCKHLPPPSPTNTLTWPISYFQETWTSWQWWLLIQSSHTLYFELSFTLLQPYYHYRCVCVCHYDYIISFIFVIQQVIYNKWVNVIWKSVKWIKHNFKCYIKP